MNVTSKSFWTHNTLFPSAAWEVTSQGGSIAANGAQEKKSHYTHWCNLGYEVLSFEVKSFAGIWYFTLKIWHKMTNFSQIFDKNNVEGTTRRVHWEIQKSRLIMYQFFNTVPI